MRTKVTVDEAVRNSGIDGSLIRAVIRQTGRENLEDIARHGVDGGFAGFIYYTETVAFYKRNRSAIVANALAWYAAEEVARAFNPDL